MVEELNSEVQGSDSKMETLQRRVSVRVLTSVLRLLRKLSDSLQLRSSFPDDILGQSDITFGAWTIVHMTSVDQLQREAEQLYRRFHSAIRNLTLVPHLLRNLSNSFHMRNPFPDDKSGPRDITFGAWTIVRMT